MEQISDLSEDFKKYFGLQYSDRSLYTALDILEEAKYIKSYVDNTPIRTKMIEIAKKGDHLLQLFSDFYQRIPLLVA